MITTITKGTVPYKPEDVDYCGERFDLLNQHFVNMIEKKQIISGSYCVAKDGKIFASAAIGSQSYKEDDKRPVKPDTIYPIASLTKLITAIAIFQLVEDGKMRVGQRVGEFIEEFNTPPYDKITVAHLLTHTSGLPCDMGAKNDKHKVSPWDYIMTCKDESWIAAALHMGMDTEPDKEWAYCSFGYVILGEIITRVSGEYADDYITNHILTPCEMNDTSFNLKMENKDRYNIRTDYNAKMLDDFEKSAVSNLKKSEKDTYFESLKIPHTGGGLFSTTGDIIHIGIMLMQNGWYNGKRILGRKAIEKMTTCCTKPDIKNFCWGANGDYRAYGLGPDMQYNHHMLYSEGSFYHEGYGTCCLLVDPFEKLAAVWFSQFEGEQWHAEALFNVSAIIWSGLK